MRPPSHATEPTGPSGGGADPAWSERRLASDPHRDPEKAARVQRMFAAIARRYDLNNRLHSFGMDQRWRRAAVRAAGELRGRRVLDVACGTGDLSIAFARAGAAEVIGADFTEAMLDIARAKASPRGPSKHAAFPVQFEFGDATALSYGDASFDIVSIAFGLRNVSDAERALREFRRVLRPGGRLVILEFDEPTSPLLRSLSRLWTRTIMPRTATLIAGDRSGAYRYLPRSVETFLDRAALADLLRRSGFQQVAQTPLSAGVAVITTATAACGGVPARPGPGRAAGPAD